METFLVDVMPGHLNPRQIAAAEHLGARVRNYYDGAEQRHWLSLPASGSREADRRRARDVLKFVAKFRR